MQSEETQMELKALRRHGWSVSALAREFGLSRATVRLGGRGSRRAVAALIELASSTEDPYVSAEAVGALATIGGRRAWGFLDEVAIRGPSVVMRQAAREALARSARADGRKRPP